MAIGLVILMGHPFSFPYLFLKGPSGRCQVKGKAEEPKDKTEHWSPVCDAVGDVISIFVEGLESIVGIRAKTASETCKLRIKAVEMEAENS